MTDLKGAQNDLMNWGRSMRDSWLEHHLDVTPPPTSEGYVAPISIHDEADPDDVPIDEVAAKITEHVVVSIGCEPGGFDFYRILVRWYTRLAFVDDIDHKERLRRLSRHMKFSNQNDFYVARTMLECATKHYWECRQDMEGLLRIVKAGGREADNL